MIGSLHVGLAALGAAPARITAVAAADVNKDGFTDFFFGRTGAASVLAASDGRGRFTATPIEGLAGVAAAQFVDLDNDGRLDIVAATAAGLVQVRNAGSTGPPAARVPVWTVLARAHRRRDLDCVGRPRRRRGHRLGAARRDRR